MAGIWNDVCKPDSSLRMPGGREPALSDAMVPDDYDVMKQVARCAENTEVVVAGSTAILGSREESKELSPVACEVVSDTY